jgi:sterol desaturase/sphingolipid hydroxylase (fatty acid hydroxylase superfamily)
MGVALAAPVLAFYAPIAAIMLFDAVLLAFLAWAYHSPRFVTYRISMMASMKVPAKVRLVNIAVSSVLSLLTMFGFTYLIFPFTFHTNPTPLWRLAFEILAILLVYDFAYYWLHRIMHYKPLMRFVHGVHHRVRNPTAMESFYLHPLELLAGLALLMLCTWAVGPVHGYAFAVVFFIHSSLNIIVHSGMISRTWFLKPLDHLTRKHTVHHKDDLDKNYASLTPLPDMLFGTYR